MIFRKDQGKEEEMKSTRAEEHKISYLQPQFELIEKKLSNVGCSMRTNGVGHYRPIGLPIAF
jgi:hypothetical protein